MSPMVLAFAVPFTASFTSHQSLVQGIVLPPQRDFGWPKGIQCQWKPHGNINPYTSAWGGHRAVRVPRLGWQGEVAASPLDVYA